MTDVIKKLLKGESRDDAKNKAIRYLTLFKLMKSGDAFSLEEFGVVVRSAKQVLSQEEWPASATQELNVLLREKAMQQLGLNSFRFVPEHPWNADAVKTVAKKKKQSKKPFWPGKIRVWSLSG